MIYSFTHLLKSYLLYTYCWPGTRNTELNKTNKAPLPSWSAESERQDVSKNLILRQDTFRDWQVQ